MVDPASPKERGESLSHLPWGATFLECLWTSQLLKKEGPALDFNKSSNILGKEEKGQWQQFISGHYSKQECQERADGGLRRFGSRPRNWENELAKTERRTGFREGMTLWMSPLKSPALHLASNSRLMFLTYLSGSVGWSKTVGNHLCLSKLKAS